VGEKSKEAVHVHIMPKSYLIDKQYFSE